MQLQNCLGAMPERESQLSCLGLVILSLQTSVRDRVGVLCGYLLFVCTRMLETARTRCNRSSVGVEGMAFDAAVVHVTGVATQMPVIT